MQLSSLKWQSGCVGQSTNKKIKQKIKKVPGTETLKISHKNPDFSLF